MKNIAWTALSADNSSTYVAPGDSSSFHGSELLRSTNSFLVDGEIAAWSLAAIGRDAVPSLMELLADPNPRLKQRAIEALGMIGADAEPAVPALVECLKNPDGDVRMRSADALGWIGCRPDLAIPPLVDALNDSDIGVEYYAAESLGRFGKSATNAIPALLKSFADRDYRIRQSAATALSKISPEITEKEVVPVLFHQLDDPNAWHNGALMDLLQLNLKPDVLIPHLIKALDDSDGSDKSIQVNAIRALGKFGPAAKEAVPKLIRLQTDENPFVRQEITNALKQIEPNHF
jgi:HEAT repeat protein